MAIPKAARRLGTKRKTLLAGSLMMFVIGTVVPQVTGSTAPPHYDESALRLLTAIQSRDLAGMVGERPGYGPITRDSDPDFLGGTIHDLLRDAICANFLEGAVLLLQAGASPFDSTQVGYDEIVSTLDLALRRGEGCMAGYEYTGDELVSLIVTRAVELQPDWRFLLTEIPESLAQPYSLQDGLRSVQPIVWGEVMNLAIDPNAAVPLIAPLEFPVAASELPDTRQPERYSAERASDGSWATSWVEGVEGPGIGEFIAFSVPAQTKTLAIVPGYGDERYFLANNRVRTARLTAYVYAGTRERLGNYARIAGSITLTFEDAMTMQEFDVSPLMANVALQEGEQCILALSIDSVYPGSRWDDTCIAEIWINGAPAMFGM